MLRHEFLITLLRFYKEDKPSNYADYSAVCNLVWETPTTIWLKGFHGDMTRKNFRELLDFLVDNKIEIVKAFRSPKHILPLAVEKEGGYFEIKVRDLVNRFTKKDN
jgi:hypothetical protein